MLKAVNDADFDEQVLNNERLVLVDFWAPWCGPCKALAPTLDALASDYEGSVEIAKVDVDDNTVTRDRYGVRGIPMLALFKNGEVVARLNGVQSRARLSALLNEHLGHDPGHKRPATTYTAFGGDDARKTSCITRLRQHAQAGSVLPGTTMWDGATGSPLGCAAEASDEKCAETLGMPLDLVHLVDVLSTYHRTPADGAQFVVGWLAQVSPGANLSGLAYELLLEALAEDVVDQVMVDDAALPRLRGEISTMLRSEIAGQPVLGSAWRDMRINVAAATVGATGTKGTLRRVLEGACWSTVDPAATSHALVAVTMMALALAMERYGWSDADDSIVQGRLNAISAEIVARGDSLANGAAIDVLRREDPELERRHQEQYAARSKAMGDLGKALGASLVLRTRSLG